MNICESACVRNAVPCSWCIVYVLVNHYNVYRVRSNASRIMWWSLIFGICWLPILACLVLLASGD
jgi:hypothetical protein